MILTANDRLNQQIDDLKYRNLETKIFIQCSQLLWNYILEKRCITEENVREFSDFLTDQLTEYVYNHYTQKKQEISA